MGRLAQCHNRDLIAIRPVLNDLWGYIARGADYDLAPCDAMVNMGMLSGQYEVNISTHGRREGVRDGPRRRKMDGGLLCSVSGGVGYGHIEVGDLWYVVY